MDAAADHETVEQALTRRRATVAQAWDPGDAVVLIGAGEMISRPGRADATYRFEAHTEYLYLTDRNLPHGVLAYDPGEGWVDFVAPITTDDRLWSGAPAEDPPGPTTDELEAWLSTRRNRPIVWLGSAPAAARQDTELSQELRFALDAVRRPKDLIELGRMRMAQRATRAAFATAVSLMHEGVSERQVQIELEAEAFRHGAAVMAYDTIVGSGPNSAVLHFSPTGRQFEAGDLVLIDAGGEYLGYASDITRTYPVGGVLSSLQQEIYSVVRGAQEAAISACRPGAEWRDIHRLAALRIAEGLIGHGLLRGDAESLLDDGAVWLFFPHGIGHLVGLGVRDAGGPLAERRHDPKPYPNLRIDLPLKPGMVVTVEPGVYFVPAILGDPANRRRYRDQVDWDKVDQRLAFGGIRLEENVLITGEGHEVITADVPLLG
ncbi:MAG TPA: aminopeptidase P N-terminal domain-containing protein [Solirubrobacteraceae bacterium]|nr:aminopeptidase P N-terminal domain-containing protein [Solirubrobacteraceae bacterium]